MDKIRELIGEVTCVKEIPNNCSILSIKDNKYKYKIENFCIFENDRIKFNYIDGWYKGEIQYKIVGTPEILTNYTLDEIVNEKNVRNNLNKIWKEFGFSKIKMDKLINYLKSGNNMLFMLINLVNNDNLAKKRQELDIIGDKFTHLSHWINKKYYNFILASLGVKNINEKDIENIIRYPFVYYKLSINTCEKICKICNVNYNEDDINAGKIARKVSEELIKMNTVTYIDNKSIYIHEINENTLNILYEKHKISYKNGSLSFIKIKNDEEYLAAWISERSKRKSNNINISDWKPNINVSKQQKEIIKNIVKMKAGIITGPAGTGKTTVTAEIASIYEKNGINYVCVSLTGKAVKVLNDKLTQIIKDPRCYTFHSLMVKKSNYINKERNLQPIKRVEYNNNSFDHCDDESTIKMINNNVLLATHLIVDEASMVTGALLCKFLRKFETIDNLIMIGDFFQLQPFIKWGKPFEDLAKNRNINIYTLEKNFRSSGNGMSINSEMLRTDIESDLQKVKFEISDDFHYDKCDEEKMFKIYKELELLGNIPMIITPNKKTVKDLNDKCQLNHMVSGKDYCSLDGKNRYYEGNPVMVTKNNYKHNIMNGDMGIVFSVTPTSMEVLFRKNYLVVNFDDPDVMLIESGLKENEIDTENVPYHKGDIVKIFYPEHGVHRGGIIENINKHKNLMTIAIEYNIIKYVREAIDINLSSIDKLSIGNMVNFKINDITYLGKIVEIDNKYKCLIVDYQGNKYMLKCEKSEKIMDRNDITLAYSITIHKSQGSEYNYVILWVPHSSYIINRNMIYTAITRAKNEIYCFDNNGEILKSAKIIPKKRNDLFHKIMYMIEKNYEKDYLGDLIDKITKGGIGSNSHYCQNINISGEQKRIIISAVQEKVSIIKDSTLMDITAVTSIIAKIFEFKKINYVCVSLTKEYIEELKKKLKKYYNVTVPCYTFKSLFRKKKYYDNNKAKMIEDDYLSSFSTKEKETCKILKATHLIINYTCDLKPELLSSFLQQFNNITNLIIIGISSLHETQFENVIKRSKSLNYEKNTLYENNF